MKQAKLGELRKLVRVGIIAFVCASFTLLYAQNTESVKSAGGAESGGSVSGVGSVENIDDEAIDEAYIDKELHALIYGADCSCGAQATPRSAHPKSAINASNNSTIDSTKYTDTKTRSIAFNGSVLYGGIFDNTSNANLYLSADRRISYALTNGTLDNGTLEIKAICEKQRFKISNFRNGDFGIYLSHNPTKEVAIALNVNTSMKGYIEAFKEIAPFVAKHILGDREKQYAKISLVIFSNRGTENLGTFYDVQEFANTVNSVQAIKSTVVLTNAAIIRSIKNFTKDNGLKKEVYLIVAGSPDDTRNTQTMLNLTKSINASIVKNSPQNADNLVKIHAFALSPNLEFLKNIAKITGGTYNEANNSYDFKKQILTLSNGGKPFDMRKLDNQIRPSKTNKIYDPDNPQDKPSK